MEAEPWNAVVKAIIKYSKIALDKATQLFDNLGAALFRCLRQRSSLYSYGAELVHDPGADHLRSLTLCPAAIIRCGFSRTHIEMILDGYYYRVRGPFPCRRRSSEQLQQVSEVGYRSNTGSGSWGIYDYAFERMRWHATMYFHGHSCGRTNPSLLEAMASNAYITAHDNPFNRNVLDEQGFYFSDEHGGATDPESCVGHRMGS
jgi:hypothetical protein